MSIDLSTIFCTEEITKATDINQADIRPLLMALAAHLNVSIWRTTETTSHVTTFELVPNEGEDYAIRIT